MSDRSGGLFTRLADMGEGAIQRVGEMPGMGRIAEPLNTLRERVDELQRRVRGLDALERRVAELERRMDAVAPEETAPSVESAAVPPPTVEPPAGLRTAEKSGLVDD